MCITGSLQPDVEELCGQVMQMKVGEDELEDMVDESLRSVGDNGGLHAQD